MPANRLRNERWRDSLWQVRDRGGSLELSIAQEADAAAPGDAQGQQRAPDLVWRVRLLDIGERELLVDCPSTCGRQLRVQEGTPLVGAMVIGQNRWMFRTRALGRADGPSPFHNYGPGTLRVLMPEHVERCPRREFMRVSTAALHVPVVECWPLLDPATVPAAEVANRAYVEAIERGERTPLVSDSDDAFALPEVGPCFKARLTNLGGGGLGLLIDKHDAHGADRSRLLWLRLDLRPALAAPLGMVGKLAHTHIDSSQQLYAGVAFEFGFHPPHREFIVRQIEAYVGRMQRMVRSVAA